MGVTSVNEGKFGLTLNTAGIFYKFLIVIIPLARLQTGISPKFSSFSIIKHFDSLTMPIH